MPHTPDHKPVDLDFSIEITPPTLPPVKPPQLPKGGLSIDTAVSDIMGTVRNQMGELETNIRTQIEGTIEDLQTQIIQKVPTKQEAIKLILQYGCLYEPQVTSTYNALKENLQKIYKIINGVKSKVDKSLKTIDKLKIKADKILSILDELKTPIDIAAQVISGVKFVIGGIGLVSAPPPTGGTLISPGFAIKANDKLKAAESLIILMEANIFNIPSILRVQIQKLTGLIDKVNPAVGALNDIVLLMKQTEASVEIAYIEWLADCNDNLDDHYRIKIYEAITDNINQFPPTNIDDWYEVSNEISKVIPSEPNQWLSSQNYQIADQAIIVTGPPPDETTGNYLIKYYAALKNNLNKYPEISLEEWNLLRAINVDEVSEDNTPEWDENIDYIEEDVVKIIIDLSEGSFNQTVSNIINAQGPEVIEKLYNANFRMIGYKRYRE